MNLGTFSINRIIIVQNVLSNNRVFQRITLNITSMLPLCLFLYQFQIPSLSIPRDLAIDANYFMDVLKIYPVYPCVCTTFMKEFNLFKHLYSVIKMGLLIKDVMIFNTLGKNDKVL